MIIRAGGSTANIALFNESQPYAIENFFNGSTNVGLTGANTDQPSKSILGPAWFEAFQTAPNGTQYIYDLNYRDNSTAGVNATVDVAKRVYDILGPSLYAFELGNEMDNKWNHTYRPDNWGPELYTQEYLEYTKLFEEHVFKDPIAAPMFQMGTLMGSGGAFINQPWNSEVILGLGIDRYGQIKSASQHDVCRIYPLGTPPRISSLMIRSTTAATANPPKKSPPSAKTSSTTLTSSPARTRTCTCRPSSTATVSNT